MVDLLYAKKCQFCKRLIMNQKSKWNDPLIVRFRRKVSGYGQKKLPTCKPDPVPAVVRVVIIYLAPALLQGSSCLPSGIGRAALSRRYTWHFSMQGLPARIITYHGPRLLPWVFTLTYPFRKKKVAVIFCGTIYSRSSPGPGS